MKNLIVTGSVAAALCSTLPHAAEASLVFSFLEKIGGGIELTMSGSLNTDNFLQLLGPNPVGADCANIFAICTGTYADVDGEFSMNTYGLRFAASSPLIATLSSAAWQEGTGDYVELVPTSLSFSLRSDYISGTELSGTAFVPVFTFESFGISEPDPFFCQILPAECSPQTAVVSGSGETDTLIFELLYEADLAAVPLPASLPLMLAGLGALALGRRRTARRNGPLG